MLGFLRSVCDGSPASFRQQLFDRVQFETALFGGSGIRHIEIAQHIEHDLGDDQPRVFLVVGGDDVPWRMMSARRVKAILVGVHVVLPEFPLVDVGGAELPVLVWFIDAREKSLSLLFVRQMQKDLDDLRPITMKVLL